MDYPVEFYAEKAGYYENKTVLDNVRINLQEGERLLIVGGSGSGKTTTFLAMTGVLVRLLNGWFKGYSFIYNNDVYRDEGFRKLPSYIGVVLQDPDKQLSMITPYDEIMFTLENLGYPQDKAREKTLKILEYFGLREKLYHDSSNLSGGEKRRLTLAASIVHEPKLLLLDEPTANIDPWITSKLRRFLKKREETLIIIEHKARFFLDLVDRVIVLDHGRIIGDWPANEVDIELLDKLGVDASSPKIKKLPNNRGDLALSSENLCVKIEDIIILENVSLEAYSGEITILIGPNGAGKTTLMKTLSGILKPGCGRVEYNFDREKNSILYIPQYPDYMFMFNTVKKELEYTSQKAGTNPNPYLEKYQWLKAVLNSSPYRLSHGQRRWLTIILALLHEPKVILLDEPTTGLDLALYRDLCRMLRRITEEDKAIIISTHDPRLIADCANKVYYVNNKTVEKMTREYALEMMENAWQQ